MDKKIIDRLEDIRNRMVQAYNIFSSAAFDLSTAIESFDEEFKDDLESYVKDAYGFEPHGDLCKMETTIDYIHNLSEGVEWYLSEQNGKLISFDEFKVLALYSPKKNFDFVYETNRCEIFNSDSSFEYVFSKTGISKSFDDAQRAIWRDTKDAGTNSYGTFYEIIERPFNEKLPLNEFGCENFRYWLFNEYGQMLDYSYFEVANHLFRGFETVRFKPGEIVLFINDQHRTLEPCIIVEPPYTITECWKLNNRLRDECIENEGVYTKAMYEKQIKGKDCYKIHTLNLGNIDCLPVRLIRASKFGDRSSMPRISSEDYRSLKVWYNNHISL